ncbi:MAG: lysylphosphatidylglycerol synthase transmembrane domain-containing protein [Actinomycetaceae bacterium]|nr:lysylphosphatidylglycerol synthase transmembrane domain-containing protein [Actinomycetaceae bacterium]
MQVSDRQQSRIHRTGDLFSLTTSILGIALVLVLGAYARGTTTGVTEDVRTALADVLRQILLLPVTVLESIFVIVVPVAVVLTLAWQKRWRTIIETILTGTAAALIAALFVRVATYLPASVTSSLTVTSAAGAGMVIDLLLTTFAAFLSAAGEASQQRSIRYGWAFVLILSVLYVLRVTLTLPAAIISILLGRAIGTAARYLFGFSDDRGDAIDLVNGLLQVGITPARIVRADLPTEHHPLQTVFVGEGEDTFTWTGLYRPLIYLEPRQARDDEVGGAVANPKATGGATAGSEATGAARPAETEIEYHLNTVPPAPSSTDRHYVCWDTHGKQYDLAVLDPDTQITGFIHDLWNNIRLRGLSRWLTPSLHANAERAALVKMAVHNAGLTTPSVAGITAAGSSVFTVQDPVPDATLLAEIPVERLTDEVLHRIVTQLHIAHKNAIAHRDLDMNAIAIDTGDRAWILNWDRGQVASTTLTRSIDVAQLLTVLALKVGSERALAAVREVYGPTPVMMAAPVLQKAVLPQSVRKDARREDVLAQLREAIMGDIPSHDVPEVGLTRFSLRTVVMAVLGGVALWVVLGSLNFATVKAALTSAHGWWIVAAFGFSLLTYLGAAIPVVAYTPEKVRLWDATLTQVAASIVTLVAPAGVGPAAVNLRFLNRVGVKTPVAVATVAFIQVSQFIVTILTLLGVVFITGRSSQLELPSTTVLYAVGGVTVVVGVILAVPWVRHWVWRHLEPSWSQVWERLVWVVGQPRRLALGVFGNFFMTVCFILTFMCSLAAFGYFLDPTTLTVTYLASNTLGSVIPSPGGIGPVEAALTGGLTVAGVPSGIAISAALIYRLVTFYGRTPLGWIGLRIMTKRGLL